MHGNFCVKCLGCSGMSWKPHVIWLPLRISGKNEERWVATPFDCPSGRRWEGADLYFIKFGIVEAPIRSILLVGAGRAGCWPHGHTLRWRLLGAGGHAIRNCRIVLLRKCADVLTGTLVSNQQREQNDSLP